MSRESTEPVVPAMPARLTEPEVRYLQLVDLLELLEIALTRLDVLVSTAFQEINQSQNILF